MSDDDNLEPLKAGLYIVATPIGNLEDITIRALNYLRLVDLILCEDTRRSHKLLSHYGIKKTLWSYNDQSTDTLRSKIIEEIKSSKAVALISDAGTPLISDPGYKLIAQIYKNDLFITSCPGACSAITALTLSGCPTNKFCFEGFLPIKQKDRDSILENIKHHQCSTILFSTPRKLSKDLENIKNILGNIEISLHKELTKIYEKRLFTDISTMLDIHQESTIKGEIVLVIPPQEESDDMAKIKNQIDKLKKDFSSKDIVKIIKLLYPNLVKKDIYKLTI